MPTGPLGFPRLTSIGPLVTDGGRDKLTLDMAGVVTDAETLGAFGDGDFITIARLPKERESQRKTVDIQKLNSAATATVPVDDLRSSVNFDL